MLWGKDTMFEAPQGTAACSSHPVGVHFGMGVGPRPHWPTLGRGPLGGAGPLWDALSLA